MRITLKKILFLIFLIFIGATVYFFAGIPPQAEKITWGVNFSQKHAEQLGLSWPQTYLALLEDLGAKHLKVAAHWDLLQPEEFRYDWEDLDWQVEQAERFGAKLMLVIGMKTTRWPECHIPAWAKDLPKEEQQHKILQMVGQIVARYKDSPAMEYWNTENEPFFPFGECPWVDKEFVRREVELVKKIDKEHPVVISDSGEGSFWFAAAKIGDIAGTTMYKKVWVHQVDRYFTWPFNPTFYWRKAQLVKRFFGKEVMVVELQAEPWGPKLLYDSPLEEQEKSMNLEQFRFMVDFARRTGLDTFYLWGSEWWYWMNEKQERPEMWNEARKLWAE